MVPEETGRELADDERVSFIEVSARDGTKVEQLFERLVEIVKEKYPVCKIIKLTDHALNSVIRQSRCSQSTTYGEKELPH